MELDNFVRVCPLENAESLKDIMAKEHLYQNFSMATKPNFDEKIFNVMTSLNKSRAAEVFLVVDMCAKNKMR